MGQLFQKIIKSKIIIYLMLGFLSCFAVTMMYISGNFSLQPFADVGDVYDVSPAALTTSIHNWIYNEDEAVYYIEEKEAKRSFGTARKERTWNYFYINLDKLSVPEFECQLIYYNNEKEEVFVQAALLSQGQNMVALNPEIPFKRLGIRVLGMQGQFFSIESIQLRENISGFTIERFIKVFSIALIGFLIILGIILFLRKKFGKNIRKINWYAFIEILQYAYQLFGDEIGKKVTRKISSKHIDKIRTGIFTLMFVYMIVMNILGLSMVEDFYRYYVLIISITFIILGIISWEKPFREVRWNGIAGVWLILCAGMCISDFFVNKDMGFAGYALIIAIGFFIFSWNNMDKPKFIIYNITQALKTVFAIAVIYCTVCREKKLAVSYNGIFTSSEEFAMYALLMFVVFCVALDWVFRNNGSLWEYIKNVVGGLLSFFFIIRTENIPCLIGAILIMILWLLKQIILGNSGQTVIKKTLLNILVSAGVAITLTACVHVAIKYVPQSLGTAIQYENEILLTNESKEIINALNETDPVILENVEKRDIKSVNMIRLNYIRKMNLLGNQSDLRVFLKPQSANSGYLAIAYKYGIYILIPVLLLQIYCVCFGMETIYNSARSNKKKRKIVTNELDCNFLILGIVIAFICCCATSNIEQPFAHPLWLAYYILPGYWFAK